MHQAEYNIGGEKILPTWVMDCGAASNMHSEKGLNRGEINVVAQRLIVKKGKISDKIK